MKVSFFVCLSCLLAAPALAMEPQIIPEPPTTVPDNASLQVTRDSSGLPHGITRSIVCVGPPKSGSAYTPGKIWVALRRQDTLKDFVEVDVTTYETGDGRTCADFYVGADAFDKYTISIGDAASHRIPMHVFYQGPLHAIPQVNK